MPLPEKELEARQAEFDRHQLMHEVAGELKLVVLEAKATACDARWAAEEARDAAAKAKAAKMLEEAAACEQEEAVAAFNKIAAERAKEMARLDAEKVELDRLEAELAAKERTETRRRLEKHATAAWGSVKGSVAAPKVYSFVGKSAAEVGRHARWRRRCSRRRRHLPFTPA